MVYDVLKTQPDIGTIFSKVWRSREEQNGRRVWECLLGCHGIWMSLTIITLSKWPIITLSWRHLAICPSAICAETLKLPTYRQQLSTYQTIDLTHPPPGESLQVMIRDPERQVGIQRAEIQDPGGDPSRVPPTSRAPCTRQVNFAEVLILVLIFANCMRQ